MIEALTVGEGRMLDALRLFFNKAKSIATFKASINKSQQLHSNEEDDAVIFGAELDNDDANLYIGATNDAFSATPDPVIQSCTPTCTNCT